MKLRQTLMNSGDNSGNSFNFVKVLKSPFTSSLIFHTFLHFFLLKIPSLDSLSLSFEFGYGNGVVELSLLSLGGSGREWWMGEGCAFPFCLFELLWVRGSLWMSKVFPPSSQELSAN
ncbi:unnamed protein product, partial [Cuscuta epithymum]